jgi:hypothetical protein
MAHLIVDFSGDKVVWSVHDQYMFGRELLVAPLMEEGATSRAIYLPAGTWHDLFLGGTIEGGQTMEYACPVERTPVFVRDGAALPTNMGSSRIIGSQSKAAGVGNDVTRYDQLAFLCFGRGSCEFSDDLGVQVFVQGGQVSGKGISEVLLVDCNGVGPGDQVQLFDRFVAARTVAVE